MERAVQQELKRRTSKVRVFPNDASLERLVSAVLVEIDDKRAADTKAHIKWERNGTLLDLFPSPDVGEESRKLFMDGSDVCAQRLPPRSVSLLNQKQMLNGFILGTKYLVFLRIEITRHLHSARDC